jgi:hypothetical protein
MVHDASTEAPCCDEPDLVTKYPPLVACRKCHMQWEREYPDPVSITVKFVFTIATETPVIA